MIRFVPKNMIPATAIAFATLSSFAMPCSGMELVEKEGDKSTAPKMKDVVPTVTPVVTPTVVTPTVVTPTVVTPTVVTPVNPVVTQTIQQTFAADLISLQADIAEVSTMGEQFCLCFASEMETLAGEANTALTAIITTYGPTVALELKTLLTDTGELTTMGMDLYQLFLQFGTVIHPATTPVVATAKLGDTTTPPVLDFLHHAHPAIGAYKDASSKTRGKFKANAKQQLVMTNTLLNAVKKGRQAKIAIDKSHSKTPKKDKKDKKHDI